MSAVAGIAPYILSLNTVQICSVGVFVDSTVVVAVHHITAHTQDLLVAHVEVHTECLRGGETLIAAETAEAVAVAVGESELIHVVEVSEESDLVIIPETVDIELTEIVAVGAVTTFGTAEPSVLHPFLYGQVDDGLLLTVIHTRQTREITLAVHNLKFVDHLHRKVLGCHFRVVGKKFLAVKQYLGHGLTIGGNRSVGTHLHAGKTFEKILDHGVGLSLIGVGIVFHRILHHLYLGLDTGHSHFAKRDTTLR